MAEIHKFGQYTIITHNITDSTQNESRILIDSDHAEAFQVITAHTQTSGRGRQGREWVSHEGNLFFSLLIPVSFFQLPQHSAMIMPLAIISSLRHSVPQMQIKWPNDVLVSGKKLCGILIEKYKNFLIIGVGVNNLSAPESLDGGRQATCLSQYIKIDNNKLLNMILKSLSEVITEYTSSGAGYLAHSYQQNLYMFGQKVEYNYLGRKLNGSIEGIDQNGDLLLRTDKGIEKFCTGEIFSI